MKHKDMAENFLAEYIHFDINDRDNPAMVDGRPMSYAEVIDVMVKFHKLATQQGV